MNADGPLPWLRSVALNVKDAPAVGLLVLTVEGNTPRYGAVSSAPMVTVLVVMALTVPYCSGSGMTVSGHVGSIGGILAASSHPSTRARLSEIQSAASPAMKSSVA